MKKLVLSLIMGAMLATNVVAASAATVDNKDVANKAKVESTTVQHVYHPMTDPYGW